MKTNRLFFALLLVGSSFVYGQTTVSVSVNSSLDDHEEFLPGPNQSNTVGDMDAASSDLELGEEAANADPQLVGMRFTNLAIPANATITNAYIQFMVDATAKNTDPCNLNIMVEDNVNPATFSDNPFSLSTRSMMTNTVTWNVSGSTWTTVGSAGPDQRTPNIASLVQAVVNKSGWASGNAIAFYIKGTGTREVESFDGDKPASAPMLVVQYNSGAATGVSEINANVTVNAYPNPFKSSFHLDVDVTKASTLSISIFDLTGKVIEEKTLQSSGTGTVHFVPTQQFNAGMYFVKVQANGQQKVIKVISE